MGIVVHSVKLVAELVGVAHSCAGARTREAWHLRQVAVAEVNDSSELPTDSARQKAVAIVELLQDYGRDELVEEETEDEARNISPSWRQTYKRCLELRTEVQEGINSALNRKPFCSVGVIEGITHRRLLVELLMLRPRGLGVLATQGLNLAGLDEDILESFERAMNDMYTIRLLWGPAKGQTSKTDNAADCDVALSMLEDRLDYMGFSVLRLECGFGEVVIINDVVVVTAHRALEVVDAHRNTTSVGIVFTAAGWLADELRQHLMETSNKVSG